MLFDYYCCCCCWGCCCESICVCKHLQARGQSSEPFLKNNPLCVLRQGLLMFWNLPASLGWLVNEPRDLGVNCREPHTWLFCNMGTANQTQVLKLVRQALFSLTFILHIKNIFMQYLLMMLFPSLNSYQILPTSLPTQLHVLFPFFQTKQKTRNKNF